VAALAVPAVAAASPRASASAARGTAAKAPRAPAAGQPELWPGDRGSSVRYLQQRLKSLKYYPGPVDGQFGTDLQEAVWAFQETQGLRGENQVTSAFWRALTHPRAPRVLVPRGGSMRIEISLAREVLVLYNHNQVELVSHVSTGGGYRYCTSGGCGTAITPTGNYRTLSYMPGWVAVPLGYMYNPVFFIGTAFAIHGDVPVPLQPVSHGCVRIPMDIAAFFHTLVKVPGTPVYIRDY
jgi:lipoprotein-anchoring transpeptidase ErfK/SrfK